MFSMVFHSGYECTCSYHLRKELHLRALRVIFFSTMLATFKPAFYFLDNTINEAVAS